MTLDRRAFLNACSAAGIASPLIPGILYTLAVQAQEAAPAATSNALPKITPEMIDEAGRLAGVGPFTPDQKKMMLDGLNDQRDAYGKIRALKLENSIPPAYAFHPQPAPRPAESHIAFPDPPLRCCASMTMKSRKPPASIEDLAFATVIDLANLIYHRKITSVALTQMYLARLKRYDPKLHFVITLTEDRALAQAKAADDDLAAGLYRGPLHGIPWGAKDLLAVKDYPTTWGAGGFEHQTFDEDATVVQRLDAAGAVLDRQAHAGRAGDGRQVVWRPHAQSVESRAGLKWIVGRFGQRRGSGLRWLRHRFGNARLHLLALHALRCTRPAPQLRLCAAHRRHGPQLDHGQARAHLPLGRGLRAGARCHLTVLTAKIFPLQSRPTSIGIRTSIGAHCASAISRASSTRCRRSRLKEAAPNETAEEKKKREDAQCCDEAGRARRDYDRQYEQAALDKLRSMGVNLIPVELPKLPWESMVPLLTAEAAAAFDDLTMSGRDRLLTEQGAEDWPNDFRVARFYPAVEYIQANRARTLAVRQFAALFEKVDVIVTPSTDAQLIATNLTGNPAVILPNGLRGADAPQPPAIDDGDHDDIGGPGTPVSLTFLGGLYQDAKLAAFAKAYQDATNFNQAAPEAGLIRALFSVRFSALGL